MMRYKCSASLELKMQIHSNTLHLLQSCLFLSDSHISNGCISPQCNDKKSVSLVRRGAIVCRQRLCSVSCGLDDEMERQQAEGSREKRKKTLCPWISITSMMLWKRLSFMYEQKD
ncbi:hypothetical protein MHYP_G00186340 [Metynnis hypsauchen]